MWVPFWIIVSNATRMNMLSYFMALKSSLFVFLMIPNNPLKTSVSWKKAPLFAVRPGSGWWCFALTEGIKRIKNKSPTVADRTDVVFTYYTQAFTPHRKQADCIVKDGIWFTYRWGYDTHTHTHTLLPGGKARYSKHWYFSLALAALAVEANIHIKPLLAVASLCTTGCIHLLFILFHASELEREARCMRQRLHNQSGPCMRVCLHLYNSLIHTVFDSGRLALPTDFRVHLDKSGQTCALTAPIRHVAMACTSFFFAKSLNWACWHTPSTSAEMKDNKFTDALVLRLLARSILTFRRRLVVPFLCWDMLLGLFLHRLGLTI